MLMNVVIAVMCGGAVVLGAHIDPHGTAEAHVGALSVGGVWQGTESCERGCHDYDSVPTMRLTLPEGPIAPGSPSRNGTYERQSSAGWEVQCVAVVTTQPAGTLIATGSLYHPDTNKLWGTFMLEGNGSNTNTSYGSWISGGSERLFVWDFTRPAAIPPPPPPPFPLSRIYTAGEGGYACHRVPAILTLPDGTLLVFAESRRPSCADQAPKDITTRRSIDGGITWSPIKRVIGQSILANNSVTYRNPYPTLSTSGSAVTVVLNVVNSTDTAPTAGWPSLQLISTDGGLTFSPPRPVAALNADPIVEGILGGPGYGIELMKHGGRLVSCGATGYHSGHAMEAAVWYSDDVGVTWNVSTTPLAQMQECQMVELANGSVVINMRAGHMDPCDCRAVSISHDGGETWSAPWYVHALIEPVCSAGFVNTGDKTDSLYFSNPNSTHERKLMTVKHSSDSGLTWDDGVLVWAGPAAYSVLTNLTADTVGLVFEHGNASSYEAISLAFVPKVAML
eukprot:m.212330 g.212330  ORF g.212330 m.212330 type:complete len:507 (+) comp25526_c1_seq1:71-1591(+)